MEIKSKFAKRVHGPPMHASQRWKQQFLREMECAKCREKKDIDLYSFDRTLVDVEKFTVEELVNRVHRMDTWCSDCGVVFNTRIMGPGRLTRKKDAAFVATLRANTNLAGIFDTYTDAEGQTITKRELIINTKNRPCAICGNQHPHPAMDFYHIEGPKVANVGAMVHPRFSLEDVVTEIQKCCVLCAVCHRLVNEGYLESPTETLRLNGNL